MKQRKDRDVRISHIEASIRRVLNRNVSAIIHPMPIFTVDASSKLSMVLDIYGMVQANRPTFFLSIQRRSRSVGIDSCLFRKKRVSEVHNFRCER